MKKFILTTAAVAAMCFTMAVSASAIYIEGQEPAYDDGMMHIMSVETGTASDNVSSGVSTAYPGMAKDMPVPPDSAEGRLPLVDNGEPQSIDPVKPVIDISEEEARKLAAEGGMSGSVGGGVSAEYPPDYAVANDLPYYEDSAPAYAADAPLMDKKAGEEPVSDDMIRAVALRDGAENAAEGEVNILAENAQEDILLTSASVSDNTQLWFAVISGAAVLAVSCAAFMVVRRRKAAKAA